MTSHDSWSGGIALRVLYIVVLTAALIISGFVFLENREIHKIIAPTVFVNLAILSGQALALIGMNYFLAIRGNNLMDATTEIFLMLAAIFTCTAILGPHMFMKQIGVEVPSWWKPWAGGPIFAPDTMFYFAIAPALVFFGLSIYRISRARSTKEIAADSRALAKSLGEK